MLDERLSQLRNSMQIASLLNSYPDWFDRFLNYLEVTFWQDQHQPDNKTPAFYVYKPYPSSVSGKQLESWIKLQEKALSPYKNGSSFSIPLKKGVAIWTAKDAFDGIPETATQNALEDGTWYVKGKSLAYRQVWKNSVMHSCESIPVSGLPNDVISINDTSVSNSWAQTRKVDDFIKSPTFGFAIVGLLAGVLALWLLTAFVVQSIEINALDNKMSALEESLGNTLSAREEFQRNSRQVEQVRGWKDELGHLPPTFAKVVTVVQEQTKWVAGKIRWQSRTLTITLFSKELDITTLVKNLEDTGLFENVSIRPQDSANLWTLEVIVRD